MSIGYRQIGHVALSLEEKKVKKSANPCIGPVVVLLTASIMSSKIPCSVVWPPASAVVKLYWRTLSTMA